MGAEPNRRLVLDGLVRTWAQRDRDNPQGSGVDAGVAASVLAEALAALDAALIERNAARAEVERVRVEVATSAAAAVQRELADVVAWLRARDGDAADSYARRIEQGAHIGAEKGCA